MEGASVVALFPNLTEIHVSTQSAILSLSRSLFLFQSHLRQAAIGCLNAWLAEITLVPFVEQEFISNALATENPNLRTEVSGRGVFSTPTLHLGW